MFKRQPSPLGPWKCPLCPDTYVTFHCTPWSYPPGSNSRTGTIRCTWRRCPKCKSFGVPGGKWISPNPEQEEK